MRRKETMLESNLIELGFRLSHKTYVGKHCDKVDHYVYKLLKVSTAYVVELDKTREHIVSYYFENMDKHHYTFEYINLLYDVIQDFYGDLCKIYDFNGHRALELEEYEEVDNDNFVEESAFDD